MYKRQVKVYISAFYGLPGFFVIELVIDVEHIGGISFGQRLCLMIVEVIVSILLIVVVVAQNSKNAGMGGAVSGADVYKRQQYCRASYVRAYGRCSALL